jgi:beta-glucanase (GH16 family)
MVESNYFGKGNTTLYNRAVYHTIQFAPQEDFHNYTLHWTQEQTQWIVDGTVVRTLHYGDANGGANYPQTPMKFYLGSWAPGDSKQPKGVIEWAQGQTDYSQGPFNMYVKSAYIADQSTGSQYTYSDRSGSWQSIKAAA